MHQYAIQYTILKEIEEEKYVGFEKFTRFVKCRQSIEAAIFWVTGKTKFSKELELSLKGLLLRRIQGLAQGGTRILDVFLPFLELFYCFTKFRASRRGGGRQNMLVVMYYSATHHFIISYRKLVYMYTGYREGIMEWDLYGILKNLEKTGFYSSGTFRPPR